MSCNLLNRLHDFFQYAHPNVPEQHDVSAEITANWGLFDQKNDMQKFFVTDGHGPILCQIVPSFCFDLELFVRVTTSFFGVRSNRRKPR